MELDEITSTIIQESIGIHKQLGPGLLESVYEKVLYHELIKTGLKVECQKAIPVYYKGIHMPVGFRADLIVEDAVIVELKSIDQLSPVHPKVLLTYLRLTDLRLGLIINFNNYFLKDGIKRVVNNY